MEFVPRWWLWVTIAILMVFGAADSTWLAWQAHTATVQRDQAMQVERDAQAGEKDAIAAANMWKQADEQDTEALHACASDGN